MVKWLVILTTEIRACFGILFTLLSLSMDVEKKQEQIVGYIERITFYNQDNGYTVAQIMLPKHNDLTCIVGLLPGVQPGQTIRCFGEWQVHLVHGKQFHVTSHRVEAPADIVGIKKYLGSGLIKGIGPKYAERIVERFGVDTLNVIESTPERLLEIPRMGKKRMELIKTCWSDQKSIRDVMVFLQTYGVSPSFAQKIFKTYGNESVAKVKEDPFRLARDVFGIGFKTADAIAQKMGIAKDSAQRIDAGVEFVLSQLADNGNACYPVDEFLKEAETILEISIPQIQVQLEPLRDRGRIELAELLEGGVKRPFIWMRALYLAEVGIVRELRRLKMGSCQLRSVDVEKAIEWVQAQLKIELAPNQKKAVANAVTDKLQIITGGPGTGKSTITNAILTITQKLTSKIVLAAPTGRAAKRMSEITGKKASTIHSLLEVDFKKGGFKRGRDNPLECDLIIVDEASMIDTFLMYNLLRALPSHARVVFVGDIHQLPSVGPGNVLKDIIASHCVPVALLTEIFRQAAGSHIITNAHSINQGKFPSIYNGQDSDFFFMDCEEPDEVLGTIVKLTSQRIPNKYDFHPLRDIQVLSPMRRGVIGTDNLNIVLQGALNPTQAPPLIRGNRSFLPGDKVMQIRNDYEKEVFNGDVGYILEIDHEDQQVVVMMDGREVIYNNADLDELVLAYAVSVHKYQGSECPCIIMPIHTNHFMLLHRNLLYTGVTRGKKLVILVGTKRALGIAVKNDDVRKRFTSLQQVLMETM